MDYLLNIFYLLVERKDFFSELVIQHLYISLISIFIAAVLGVTLGIFISEFRKISGPIMGIINFMYTIPSIACLGFLVSLTGIGNTTAIIALSLYGLLPMVSNTFTGIKNVDDKIIEAGIGMGSTRTQLLFKIKLPLALSVITSGFRNMAVMTIALCGIASFVGAGGIGVAIWRGITTNNTQMTIVGSVLIACIALISDRILGSLEKYINRRTFAKIKKRGNLRNKQWMFILGLISILLIFLVFNGGKVKDRLVIASKQTTEQYILSEILAQLIEDRLDIEVELKKGIGGGTANIHTGMMNGEIDIYPEYTGTAWEYVLKNKKMENEMEQYDQVKKEYIDKFNFKWIGLYGFNSTYALAISNELSYKYNINSYSDLAQYSDKLIFGAEYDFYEREDGYDSLIEKYGFNFKDSIDLDIGLKYKALSSGKVDVINAFATDAQLYEGEYKILKDDKMFFPSYLVGTVIRQEAIDGYEGLEEVLMLLNNNISEDEIINMNYKVDVEKREDKEVAKEFLQLKGLIE